MKLVRLLAPIFLVGLCINNAAETKALALDPAQEQFFSRFRTAIHGEDTRQLLQLTHPQAKACTKVDEQEHYYGLIMKGLVQMLGHQQTIKEISSMKVADQDLKPVSDPAAKGSMVWPVPPEEQLLIKYVMNGSEDTATIYIARDQNQWKWVHRCFQ